LLVVTKKQREPIQIGENIFVEVLAVRSDGTVKIGITAPRDVPVRRDPVCSPRGDSLELAQSAAQ